MSAVKQKKILAFFFTWFMLGIFAASTPVGAQIGPAGQDTLDFLGKTAELGGLTENSNAPTDPMDIVIVIINTVLGLVGIIFFVQMFYAGFRWMTSGGSEEIIKESKQTIRSAVIGITIVFASFVLTNFVINRIQGISETTAPPAAPAAPSTNSTAP
ncbi:MAG: hypothetical protein A3H70_04915 [Candidatus Komeilibacteria bacterium RIFCSPLOWO2_02_FULL_48_11]|uniref:Uncharacterized protein n=1 Tax=Candidatus Komeilibacteria bacterium RIFCSPLOWO2_02_FULL_48_11 TaxID=1798553 RepID=A0A1G2BRY6_9BACT|nr:MAG: hypothetical protein A3H70_04915 [Candidatus Komeilibacteria bacterium RIFCSPLOWO2_02_FULL_48_11]